MPLAIYLQSCYWSSTIKTNLTFHLEEKKKSCLLEWKFQIVVKFFPKGCRKPHLISSGKGQDKVRGSWCWMSKKTERTSQGRRGRTALRGPGSSAAAASHLASGLLPDTSGCPPPPTLLLRPALEETHAKTGWAWTPTPVLTPWDSGWYWVIP